MSSEFEKIRRCCLKSGQLFEDPDFPCIQSSVFYHETPPFNFTWMRPHEICHEPQFLQIPDSVSEFHGKGNLTQSSASESNTSPNFETILGKLGDPWFISSISTLYQTKGLFYRVVPADQSFHEMEYAGIFRFRIWWFGQWQEVIIDDRLPIVSHDKLAFIQAINGNTFWPCLLEKAFAKLHGSYEALKYGSSLESLSDLTGGVTELIDLKSDPMSMINTRILMQRLLSITSIVTAVISIDEVNNAGPGSLFRDDGSNNSGNSSPRILPDSRARQIQQQQQEQFMFGDDVHPDDQRHHRGKSGERSKRQSGYHHFNHHDDRNHHHRDSSSLSSSSSDHSPLHSLVHHHHLPDASFTSTSSSPSSNNIVPFPRIPCGIIGNVNYRITRIERVETVIGENREQIFLLKVINSTGSSRCHYTGPFGGKHDDAWNSISDCDRLRISAIDEEEDDENPDIVYEPDLFRSKKHPKGNTNSFWIEFTDFMRIFTHLEVVYLDSETSRDEPSLRNNGCGSSSRFPMIVKLYRGSWRKGVTAGGCRNNVDSFHQNPQIELTLSLESDDMMIICLNQHSVLEPQVVGFSIYRSHCGTGGHHMVTSSSSCSSASSSPLSLSSNTHISSSSEKGSNLSSMKIANSKLEKSFFKKNKSLMNSSYSNSRQVLLRCSLDRGSYVLIPTTFEPGIESGFTIRVYSMKGIKLRLLDHENCMSKSPLMKTPSGSSSSTFDHKFSEYEILFMQLADEHKTITAHDLHELLDTCLPNDYVKSCANIDVARLMISAAEMHNNTMMQQQLPGRLHFKDYKVMMCSLRYWQSVFKNHTRSTTGILRIEKLEDALIETGFTLSSDVLMALVTKFMRKDSTLRFGDFVSVILHLSICFNSFTKNMQKQQQMKKTAIKQNSGHLKMITTAISNPVDHSNMITSSVCLSITDWLKLSFQT